jgi:hypothetical protein
MTNNNMDMMPERVESVKAATLGGLSIFALFVITTLINNLLLVQYFALLNPLRVDIHDYRSLISAGIASLCGFLFGVTYRYIIRTDNNPQLKAGGVMAFGLIRGLTQIEIGSYTDNLFPFVVLAGESILYFGVAALVLNIAIQRSWVKPFKG